LSFAYANGKDFIVNYLSLRVKNLDTEDPEGYTVFSRYVLDNNLEMANKLISRGAQINFTNREGKTALTLAIKADSLDAV
jgi:ankyrin repeat protein